MSNQLYAPKIDRYIVALNRNTFCGLTVPRYNKESLALIDELFSMMRRLMKPGENSCYLWVCADRGPIEAFGNVQEWINDGEVETAEEFKQIWKSSYPTERKWYNLIAVEDGNYRAIYLRHKQIIEINTDRSYGEEVSIVPVVSWLVGSVRDAIKEIENGTYADKISQFLPPEHKTGIILRRDLWNIFPEERELFLKDICKEDVADFINYMVSQDHKDYKPLGRIKSMTANDFYRFCALGYQANNYPYTDEMSPKDQYYRNADGRDEGLRDVALNDPDAFKDWLLESRMRGGHPWEVCMGGNSTHISLYVGYDNGYYLSVAGNAMTRTIEAVKFYLALRREGLPVFMHDGDVLASRFLETEKIGIVPDGVMPVYCSSMFPDEKIIAFRNLPDERIDEVAAKCVWQPFDDIKLWNDAE